jgi:Ser/Thr protein kinase RdoA (MazF antagonist)
MICTLISYLDGEAIAPQDYTPTHAQAVGRVAAQIHGVQPDAAAGIRRPRLDFAGLFGPQSMYATGAEGAALLAPHQPVLEAVTGRTAAVFSRLDTEGGHFGLIHGDLKPDNLLFLVPDQPHVLDFDDCGWGYFLYDLAPLLLFLRPPHPPPPSPSRGEGEQATRYQALKAALLNGYTAVRPLADWQFDALETLVAGRFAASCLWVAAHRDHPAYRGKVEDILAERAARLGGFLATGTL